MTRLAIVRQEKCNPKKCGNLCSSICPVNRMKKECIKITAKAAIDEFLCTGCGICPKRCPYEAITVINLPEALKEKPVFRYGKNSFELFRIPIPQKQKVVGILGANGIGKSTALEILSGIVKPNLGVVEGEVTDKEIFNHFKGSELLNFFKNLFEKGIKVSYKPQYIDNIPKQFKGSTARELLMKVSTKAKVEEIAKKFNILEVIDRKLEQLSGGELQRVAISAAMLKDADLYLFDEPASYLDIKERINAAKIIQELAQKGKQVIVVEHDLIILDYLAELIHVLYGQTATYGVVSHPKSALNGVNEYLDGYLKDENMRFRDTPIKFEKAITETKRKREFFIQWPELQLKLGTFKLSASQSGISEGEIIGILGANATGKTTFARILAGEIKPDAGEIDARVKISYKPQYIKGESESTVMQALLEVNKEALSQDNKINVLRPLEIEHLMQKSIKTLSGGELQRVSIAICLLREADLYLLDEPSTYLDVEQRLQTARAIQKVIKGRENISAIVIDHDLLFISYIADKIMSFSGMPGKSGAANQVKSVKEGMNDFLKELDITLRKEPNTNRPRVNKPGSVKDREQRKSGDYYG